MRCPICEDELIMRFKCHDACHYDCRYNGHSLYIEFHNNEAVKLSYKANNGRFILSIPYRKIYINEYDVNSLYIDYSLSKSKLNQDNFYLDPDEFNYIKRKVATYLILQ